MILHKIEHSGSTISFRPATQADEPLLSAIYAGTRTAEMALLPDWPKEAISAFLQQQFEAQHTYYHSVYPNGDYLVILFNDQPAGRLYLNRSAEELRIVDIALLDEFRKQGIGTRILHAVLDAAAADNLRVRIHVERFNPAKTLYDRLGFKLVDETNNVYLLLEWRKQA